MTPDPQLRWIIPSERLHVFLNPPSPLAYLLILLWHVPNHSITRYYPNPFLGWDISQNIFTHNDNEYLYLMSTEYIACPTTSLISGIKVERLILMFTCSPVSTVKKNVTKQIRLIGKSSTSQLLRWPLSASQSWAARCTGSVPFWGSPPTTSTCPTCSSSNLVDCPTQLICTWIFICSMTKLKEHSREICYSTILCCGVHHFKGYIYHYLLNTCRWLFSETEIIFNT